MVLGYFGKTPVEPDKSVVKLASEQLSLKPTKEHAMDIADKDESKSLKFTRELLKKEGIEPSDENIFIAAACKEKGIAFLKGEGKVNIRKKSAKCVRNGCADSTRKNPDKRKNTASP